MSNSHLSRSFGWLNATQFLGALNDNVFKLLVIFFLLSLPGAHDQTTIITSATALFVAPFLLFSHAAGVLADRISKRTIIVFAKFLEAGIMVLGCLCIFLKIPFLLYGVIFLMGAQSALFGPSKYGIIPELVSTANLSRANGLIVGATYFAIIIGTFLPSFLLLNIMPENFPGAGVFCVGISVIGILTSLPIERTPAAGSTKRFTLLFVVEIIKTLRDAGRYQYLLPAVLGVSYFVYIGAFMQQNILLYAQDSLNLTWIQSGYLFPVAALGIGVGALMAGRLSGRNIEFGVVPLGAFGLAAGCMALNLVSPGLKTISFIIFLMGVSAGLFIVPLIAFIQYKSPRERLGQILASENFVSFSGVALAAGTIKFFDSAFHLTPSQGFLIIGLLTAALSTLTIIILPVFFVRFIIMCLTKFFYRIRVINPENLPTEGAALLVSNHVTWADPLLLGSLTQRRIRFVMGREIFSTSWMKPFFKLVKTIPISPADAPRAILNSLKQARSALESGYLVCVFAEGAITRNGNMLSFKPGLERIVKDTNYPLIPIHIGGAWGNTLSYYHGRLLSSLAKCLRYPVVITYGKPLRATSTSSEIRQTVLELSASPFDLQKSCRRSLARLFARSSRQNWKKKALTDTTGKCLTYGQALTAALALSAELDSMLEGQNKAGVILPASAGGALTNIALTLLGKVPVNLNFTTSLKALFSAIRQCEIKTVISSRLFLEKLAASGTLQAPNAPEYKFVFLEDIAARIPKRRKLSALLKARLAPISALGGGMRVHSDGLAAIIFSSGSTGEPKGVMLSHHNIISNIESFSAVCRFKPDDRLCAILPFFHSFGFTCTLWTPLINGFSVYYHPNPLDALKVAEMVRANRLSILLATPTFLLSYSQRARREDFASLRLVVAGGEKLKKYVADSFEEKFGMRPLEGYGATELSPVAALNIPDVTIDQVHQTGTKEGSIGHPIPGVAMKIVDPQTLKPLPALAPGLLMVKGPNVMLGYLNQPEKTHEVLQDLWYNTGDIATMDNDGFVFIHDRFSRYSKIGGEMVPHLALEDTYLKKLGAPDQVIAVTSAPHQKKGEQLVVFYLDQAGDLETLDSIARESDLPPLWKPKKENYVKIDSMPILGIGKLDLKRLKQMAAEFVGEK